ncbi:MAG: hypothetical protein COB02_15125 [Candidatus Cloacimonadota bacterium]|nr:MAG: hypothetical protein COB02_15125 [Candidatus Cloacimonadota bacterium]
MKVALLLLLTFMTYPSSFDGLIEFESVFDTSNLSSKKQEIIISPEFSFNLKKVEFISSLRIRSDLKNSLGSSNLFEYQSDLSKSLIKTNSTQIAIRELYVDEQWGPWMIRLGKQQIVWGQADGLKVLDQINPQSFREFILDSFEDSRIGQWSIQLEKDLKHDKSLQLFSILDNTHNEIMDTNSEYAFSSKYITSKFKSQPVLLNVQRGSGLLKNSSFGVRLSEFKNGWDLTYNYLYFKHHSPVLYSDLTKGVRLVFPEYERSHLLGASASNSFGYFTLRFELAYLSDQYNLAKDINFLRGIINSSEVNYVLGIDWTKLSNTFISFQVFQSYVLNDAQSMIRDELDTKLSFLVKKDFLNETLSFELFYLYSVNDGDGLFRPRASYEFNTDQKIILSLDIFHGDVEGLFGQFSSKDRISLSYEWGF